MAEPKAATGTAAGPGSTRCSIFSTGADVRGDIPDNGTPRRSGSAEATGGASSLELMAPINLAAAVGAQLGEHLRFVPDRVPSRYRYSPYPVVGTKSQVQPGHLVAGAGPALGPLGSYRPRPWCHGERVHATRGISASNRPPSWITNLRRPASRALGVAAYLDDRAAAWQCRS